MLILLRYVHFDETSCIANFAQMRGSDCPIPQWSLVGNQSTWTDAKPRESQWVPRFFD